jgi:hypothetical protein
MKECVVLEGRVFYMLEPAIECQSFWLILSFRIIHYFQMQDLLEMSDTS